MNTFSVLLEEIERKEQIKTKRNGRKKIMMIIVKICEIERNRVNQ